MAISDSTHGVLNTTATDMTDDKHDRTSFLDLPAEIRNHIYKDTLVELQSIKLRDSPPFIQEPNLLFICKQVRTEALSIFYGANRWESYRAKTLELFMQTFKREKLAMLRCLYIITPAEIDKIRREVALPSLHAALYQNVNAVQISGELYMDKITLREERQLGEKLTREGEKHGIQKAAMLLPVLTTDCEHDKDILWVSLDEFNQYTVEEKDGKVIAVKSSTS